VLACLPVVRRQDASMRVRDADIETLRAIDALGVLPAATIEQLGAGLVHAAFEPGETVFEQGDVGDRFYVVESGSAEVRIDGRLVNTLGKGDGFGEIALLDDEPRSATIRASVDAPLVTGVLERRTYLTAVTGYPASATAGRAAVSEHRARDAAGLSS
jgi:CRP-like cAMP-binding protein